MVAGNIGQRLETERSRIVLVGSPGTELDGTHRFDNFRIVAEREARPLLDNLLRTQVGIPCKAPEAIEIRLRHMVAVPAFVEPNVGHADYAAGETTENFAS